MGQHFPSELASVPTQTAGQAVKLRFMTKRRDAPASQGTVEIEHSGKMFTGGYAISRGKAPMIEVTCSSPSGNRVTQLGNTPADMLARMLLSEIVGEGLQRATKLAKGDEQAGKRS